MGDLSPQHLHALLLRRLDRDRRDLPAAVGLQNFGRIGAVGFVAAHVRPHVAGMEQAHLMTVRPGHPLSPQFTDFYQDTHFISQAIDI